MNSIITVEDFLEQLRAQGCVVRPCNGGGYIAQCPAHDDRNPSLSVKEGSDGRLLLKCHAGCAFEDILKSVLGSLQPEECASDDPRVSYPYRDLDGNLLYEVVRIGAGKSKRFFQRRPIPGYAGEWVNSLVEGCFSRNRSGKWEKGGDQSVSSTDSVRLPPIERTLYRLPELVQGVAQQDLVFFVEGEKDVERLVALGLAATTSGAAESWQDRYAEYLMGASVAILPDADVPGRRFAASVASSLNARGVTCRIVELPGLADGQDVSDWLVAGNSRSELECLVEQAFADNPCDWEDPHPLPALVPHVQEFDLGVLSLIFREYVVDRAELMQVPPEYIAVPLMISLGATVGRAVSIQPKENDTSWRVVPNLWGAVVGDPGVMKSPAANAGLHFIQGVEETESQRYDEGKYQDHAEREIKKARLEAIRLQLKRADDSKSSDLISPVKEIADLQADLDRSDGPVRLLAHDSTIEKLAILFSENSKGLLLIRDELEGFLRQLEKQGREGDRAFYLEAWNGNNQFSVDRVGRGSLRVPYMCLSIFGTIQPGRIRSHVAEVLGNRSGNDGLLQRFQLLVWPDHSSEFVDIDRAPNNQVAERIQALFDSLHHQCSQVIGEESEITARFDRDAQPLFAEWRRNLEVRLRSGGDGPAITSHLSKYRSLAPKLALLTELAEKGEVHDGLLVGRSSLEKALRWCDYLESHLTRIYAEGARPAVIAAHALLDRMRAGDIQSGMTVREIYRKGWRSLKTSEAVEVGLEELQRWGWCRVRMIASGKAGGQPSAVVELHPHLKKGR